MTRYALDSREKSETEGGISDSFFFLGWIFDLIRAIKGGKKPKGNELNRKVVADDRELLIVAPDLQLKPRNRGR